MGDGSEYGEYGPYSQHVVEVGGDIVGVVEYDV